MKKNVQAPFSMIIKKNQATSETVTFQDDYRLSFHSFVDTFLDFDNNSLTKNNFFLKKRKSSNNFEEKFLLKLSADNTVNKGVDFIQATEDTIAACVDVVGAHTGIRTCDNVQNMLKKMKGETEFLKEIAKIPVYRIQLSSPKDDVVFYFYTALIVDQWYFYCEAKFDTSEASKILDNLLNDNQENILKSNNEQKVLSKLFMHFKKTGQLSKYSSSSQQQNLDSRLEPKQCKSLYNLLFDYIGLSPEKLKSEHENLNIIPQSPSFIQQALYYPNPLLEMRIFDPNETLKDNFLHFNLEKFRQELLSIGIFSAQEYPLRTFLNGEHCKDPSVRHLSVLSIRTSLENAIKQRKEDNKLADLKKQVYFLILVNSFFDGDSCVALKDAIERGDIAMMIFEKGKQIPDDEIPWWLLKRAIILGSSTANERLEYFMNEEEKEEFSTWAGATGN